MKRIIAAFFTLFFLLAAPAVRSNAGVQSGILIHNKTNYCAWVTAYTGGKIVHSEGFPGWVSAQSEGTYPIDLRGPGEEFRVRVEILSTRECKAQTSEHPLLADIDTHVQGGRAYRVRILGGPKTFSLERY